VSDPNPCYPQIGWREWLKLPDLGVTAIKAKVDTGARSSALHAFDVETIIDGDKQLVRFKIHPLQRDCDTTVEAIAEVVEYRRVRSSLGEESLRPVILTAIELLGQRFEVELTLVRRDTMGFRMLLGRQAIRRRFVVDPGCSYRNGRLHRKKKRRKTE
jgi:hypothetical protein